MAQSGMILNESGSSLQPHVIYTNTSVKTIDLLMRSLFESKRVDNVDHEGSVGAKLRVPHQAYMTVGIFRRLATESEAEADAQFLMSVLLLWCSSTLVEINSS